MEPSLILLMGLRDIKAKRVRMVQEENLETDTLRILRAVRFATVLDFKIESKTLEACKRVIHEQHEGKLPLPAWERVAEELDKIIMSQKSSLRFSFA